MECIHADSRLNLETARALIRQWKLLTIYNRSSTVPLYFCSQLE